jgi:hypothetical protein
MDGLLVLIIVIVALVALDVAAARWGADSRPGMADDHRR